MTDSRSRILSATGVLLAVATGIAAGMWFMASEPASSDTPSNALRDADDDTPVMPSAAAIAKIAPHPLNTVLPVGSPVSAPTTPPNVVVVIGCTLRKDQISVYGGPANTTPTLSGLAARGTVFDDVITATPWTRPAITALLTGQYAVDVGMVEPNRVRNDRALDPAIPTLATILHDAGYITIGASANPNITSTFGFANGFDAYQLGLEPDWHAQIDGRDVMVAALRELEQRRTEHPNKPFLLRLVTMDTHARRLAPRSEWEAFTEPELPARVARYRAHLRRVDDAIALLLRGLDRMGVLDNTVVVVLGDHGEGMNYPEAHGRRHGLYFGSSVSYVPWIMAGPGVSAHHTVLGVASGIDVLPTLLRTIGIAAPASLPGRDLSGLVRGEGHTIAPQPVFSDTWFARNHRSAVFLPDTMCQAVFRKARGNATSDFVEGCFDRHADPLFLEPIEAPELRSRLNAWHEAHVAEQGSSAKVDAQLADQLRKLGYTDDEADAI